MVDKTADNGMGNWQPAQGTGNWGVGRADPAMQGGAPGVRRVRLKDGVPQVDPYPDAANDGFIPIPPSQMGDVSDIMTSDEIAGFENTKPADNRTLLITDGYQRKAPQQREKEPVPRAISLVSFIDVVRDVSPSGQTAPAPAQQGNSKKIDPWVDLGDNGITTNLNLNDPKIRQMIKELQITFPSMGFFPGVADINKVGQEEEKLQPLREPGDLDKHLILNHHVEVNTTLYELPLLNQLHQQMHAQGESSDHNPEVLKVANILDPIQETLDPKVWDNPESEAPRLKSSMAAWIRQAIFGTLKNAGYKNPENWIKLIVTGSLTTYQWSENSDLDVSIWVDLNEFPDFQRSEIIKVIINNLDGDMVPGTFHPIQCFVVDVNEIKSPQEIYKTGVRSAFNLDTNEWIVKPERNRSANVRSQFPDFFRKARQASAKMQLLLKYQPQAVKTYWHFLHKRRRDDMKAGMGDYSESNIVYKMLANDGLFDDIERITGDHIASVISNFVNKVITQADGMHPYWDMGSGLIYLTEDDGILCADCANGKNGSEARINHSDPEWNLVGTATYDEGPISNCSHCNSFIFPNYPTDAQEKEIDLINQAAAHNNNTHITFCNSENCSDVKKSHNTDHKLCNPYNCKIIKHKHDKSDHKLCNGYWCENVAHDNGNHERCLSFDCKDKRKLLDMREWDYLLGDLGEYRD